MLRSEYIMGTWWMPLTVFTTIGKKATTQINQMEANGLRPKKARENGTEAGAGTVRRALITWSSDRNAIRLAPIRTPRGTPIPAVRRKPEITLRPLAETCSHQVPA